MYGVKLLLVSPMIARALAQLTQPISPGVLSLLTPAINVSTVKSADISALSSHATSFRSSYVSADTFNFTAALTDYEKSALRGGANGPTLVAYLGQLGYDYLEYWTSLLDSPDKYFSTLRSDVSFLPSSIQYEILSQATNLLSGFESLATQDVLHQTPSKAPITPGASVDVGFPSPTAAPTSNVYTPAPQATPARAHAAPAVTAPVQLLAAAAVGAAGAVGAVLL